MRLPGPDLLPAAPPRTAPEAAARPGGAFPFSLEKVPFSHRGAWLALNRLSAARARELGRQPGLYLRTCHGGVPMADRQIFRLEPGCLKGSPAAFTDDATPARLALRGSGHRLVEAAFSAPDTLRLRGRACTLRLVGDPSGYDFIRPLRDEAWELNLFSRRIQLLVTSLAGRVAVRAPWEAQSCLAIELLLSPDPRHPDGWWEIELREFTSTCPERRPPLPFESAVVERGHEFEQWLQLAPPVPAPLRPARALAAYVQWSALAAPAGRFIREVMLMSKDRMPNIWSWDHCFNAVALAARHPRLAWDQWAIPFDFQNAHGALPDSVNDHDIVWNFTKPPVHGWALREMMARGFRPDHAQLRQARAALARWTDWWLRDRDDDHDGLPQYNHGNDSGWDNASVFSAGTPVESPDLAALLVVQMDVLAELCERLARAREAARWRARATSLVARLLEHSWRGDRFVALRSGEEGGPPPGDSLIAFAPLLLGDRLPLAHREAMVRRLTGFLAPAGPASEHPESALYHSDGYWRGPVWAPAALLVHSGLLASGRPDVAARLAADFCATVAASGCAERFDAFTGAGQGDHAHTWTASVFLLLAASA